ncbi:hypothetical protein GO986_15000 [Deinococcus sp. HMF7620]|uniref:Uncharacterized protein n=1 Tax=Deinococcus arboris TaxID=2682977 RepID=A0A7C9LSC8_9DEIO|nr:hypothetical protein [Deinococcus arboris]MVN88061.1 hypothetical protein [Deinococcus arboris]
MLDNILNTVKRGAERVQRRGEEVAHTARLRMEVFQLGRELDALYGRLGRSYHSGADREVLGGIQDDIRRVEDEIRAREHLMTELGSDPEMPQPSSDPMSLAKAPLPTGGTEPNVPAAVPRPHPQEATMSDADRNPYQTPADRTPEERPAGVPTSPDPTMQHSDDRLVPGEHRAGVALEAERDKQFRHDNTIEEGKAASRNPDPLDK